MIRFIIPVFFSDGPILKAREQSFRDSVNTKSVNGISERTPAQDRSLHVFRTKVVQIVSFWIVITSILSGGSLLKKNSVVLVRKRTIPTERQLLVGEVIANFCG
jgi:hypothetical protein